jgi:hypothetical protein
MSYLIAGGILVLIGVFTGAYIQHKAELRETPIPERILPKKEDDLPGPISPYEEARKTRREMVKV